MLRSTRFRLGWSVLLVLGASGGCSTSSDGPSLVAARSSPNVEPSTVASASAAGASSPVGVCLGANPLGNLYWGDLHVHTSYSMDAYGVGTRVDPKDAYAFARGGTVTVASGVGGTTTTKLRRPLDFAAVTDHAEMLALTGECLLDPSGGRPYCDVYRDSASAASWALRLSLAAPAAQVPPPAVPLCEGEGAATCAEAAREAWDKVRQAAKAANTPCSFTSFVGYEWSSTPSHANLHRNVLFAGEAVPDLPFDSRSFYTPLMLWKALESGCRAEQGCDAITIPHNSNFSDGTMWDTADDPSALPYMARYQLLAEVIQHKGASECLASSQLGDPSCEFETASSSADDASGMIRDALARGLEMRASGGTNPLTLGMVASTDTHNGTPGNVDEGSWPGHGGSGDDSPERRLQASSFNPGGLAGVWASENTRAAIFSAFKRREVYATSGPRIPVRFYALGGSVSDARLAELCGDPSFPSKLVGAGGKPMGSVVNGPGAVSLFVSAMKDETPLEEIDIVKLSIGPLGRANAKVQRFTLAQAQSSAACIAWRDPELDPRRPAVYYARVYQRPTWRWSHYDCAAMGASAPKECAPGGTLDVQIRERAWTSPIFVDR